ncbi:MAG: hypothetical protein Q4C96_03975 [Planctomycetia bacterium]|nr:hypothetical protein [Planctomycetia bacterium]
MSFQFYCPNGHLLQGEESQAGMVSLCPNCQAQFIIPQPPSSGAGHMPPVPPPVPPAPSLPVSDAGSAANEFPFSSAPNPVAAFMGTQNSETNSENPFNFGGGFQNLVVGEGEFHNLKAVAPKTASTVKFLHIPCPKGHIMEVPRDYLGEEVVCPQCGKEFILRYEKSLEYQKEKDLKETAEAARYAKNWLIWSIVMAICVLLAVIFLICSS